MLKKNVFVWSTLFLSIIFFAFHSTAQVIFVLDGTSTGVIVTAEAPTKTTLYAAQELVLHIEKATGVTVPVVSESNIPDSIHTRVYIGDTETGRRYGIDTENLPREAYIMRSVGNDLFIAGQAGDGEPLKWNNPNAGTLFGVYEFLERYLGVLWLWPGELGTYVPKTNAVQLWSVNETKAPDLAFRRFSFYRIGSIIGGGSIGEEDARLGFSADGAVDYAKALEVFLRRQRMGGTDTMPPTGHHVYGWWKRYGKEHPEWFALREDGTRGHPDPEYNNVPMCITNEEFQDFMVTQWDGKSTLILGPVDRPGRCLCDKCRAWDGPQPETSPWFASYLYGADPRSEGLFGGATSDRYARFWQVIQEKARKRNPDVQMSISFIYENEFSAPVTDVKLDKSIYGSFVQWQDPYLRYFPMPDEALKWIKEQWVGWRATGIRMGYRPNYLHDGYVMPHFDTQQEGEFFKFAYERGMEGADFDSLTGQWSTQGPRLYLHMRLMAKPELELDVIRQEYLSAFGPAAKTMDQYFAYWEKYARDNVVAFTELYSDLGRRYANYIHHAHEAFPPESFVPAEALLEKALSETRSLADPQFFERVRFIGLGLEHAQLATALAAVYDGAEVLPGDKVEEATKVLQELVAFRKAHEGSFFSDLYHATGFWERPEINLDDLISQK
jgi:hypothetical protein